MRQSSALVLASSPVKIEAESIFGNAPFLTNWGDDGAKVKPCIDSTARRATRKTQERAQVHTETKLENHF